MTKTLNFFGFRDIENTTIILKKKNNIKREIYKRRHSACNSKMIITPLSN